jgi:prephenate dehydratase
MQDLKSKKISLKCLWGFSKQGGESELVVIAKDTDKIKSAWTSSGMSAEEGTAFFFKGTDKAGALLEQLQKLADAQVNMKALHAIAVSGKFGSLVWVDPADVEKASQALGAK